MHSTDIFPSALELGFPEHLKLPFVCIYAWTKEMIMSDENTITCE